MKKSNHSEDTTKTEHICLTDEEWMSALQSVQDSKKIGEKSVKEICGIWGLCRSRAQELLNKLQSNGKASVRKIGHRRYWSLASQPPKGNGKP